MIDVEQKYNIYDIGFNKYLTKEEETSLGNLLEEGLSSAFIMGGGGLSNFNLKISENTQIGDNLASNLAFLEDGVLTQDLINNALDTQSKQILGEFTFGSSGAIKIATDDNNGVWISPNGILGKKAGSTTFSLTSSGDATFKGEVLAGSIISCDISADRITTGTLTGININAVNITGSTITGGIIRTATSGQRIVITDTDNSIAFYDANGNYCGEIIGQSGYLTLIAQNQFQLEGGDIYANGTIYVDAAASPALVPQWDNSNDLGTSTYRFKNLYLGGNIYINGTVDGVDISAHAASASAHHTKTQYLSEITVNTDLDMNIYDIYDLKYLKFNSSYGRIYWGGDLVLDIGVPNSACMTIGKHLYPTSTAAHINIGTTNQYFQDVYADKLYYKTGTYSFDEYDDLALIKGIKVEGKKIKTEHLPTPIIKEGFWNIGAFNALIIGALKQLIQKVEALEAKINQ